ncbi:malonyl-CoA decarboxylase, mitochondrial-like [Bolinopsis microptera]|uniref:malonyl-CoA decarboxylase, mitochondrial-like n=1 Tax=Bolinopsis microptera TaxID=2820187 RepID=UPI0030793922
MKYPLFCNTTLQHTLHRYNAPSFRGALARLTPCVATRRFSSRVGADDRNRQLSSLPIRGDYVGEAIKKSSDLTPRENVRHYLEIMNKSIDIENDVLKRLCESPEGLTAVMDARAECNDMIVKLPRPELMKLDKILFKVLRFAVTFDNTEISTVKLESPKAIVEMVRSSDRVHPIKTQLDLQNRLAENRSVFVLTHTLLPSRPLVILHVAHSSGMFQCVSDIKEGLDESLASSLCTPTDGRTHGLDHGREISSGAEDGEILSCTRFTEDASYRRVNTFYSISSLEVALRGIPCGGWCIGKAKSQLTAPRTLYTTLSPIPGLRNWISVSLKRPNPRVLRLIATGSYRTELENMLSSPSIVAVPEGLQATVSRLAAYYLTSEKQRGNVLDPVGHFHVTNGAVVWGLRWGGTRSVEMQEQSLGLMVNYLYDTSSPHRATQYASDDRIISVGPAVSNLLLD